MAKDIHHFVPVDMLHPTQVDRGHPEEVDKLLPAQVDKHHLAVEDMPHPRVRRDQTGIRHQGQQDILQRVDSPACSDSLELPLKRSFMEAGTDAFYKFHFRTGKAAQ